MSYIQAVVGGKQKGLADQVSIDPAFGCKNKCLGCYAKKSSQRGGQYDNVIKREYNKEVLERSIKNAQRKGFFVARVGKHCDPGDHNYALNHILSCSNDLGMRCVVVSKSLRYLKRIKDLIYKGNHLLHFSLGPPSDVAPSDAKILDTAMKYDEELNKGQVSIRFTRDITREMIPEDKCSIKMFNYIVTPMRYPSRKMALDSGANLNNFSFVDGYWRPLRVHKEWRPYMKKVCGEINGKVRCCNCNLIQ